MEKKKSDEEIVTKLLFNEICSHETFGKDIRDKMASELEKAKREALEYGKEKGGD